MIGLAKRRDRWTTGHPDAAAESRQPIGVGRPAPTEVIIAAARRRQQKRRRRVAWTAVAATVIAVAGGIAGWRASSTAATADGGVGSLAGSQWKPTGQVYWDHGSPGNLAVLPAPATISCNGKQTFACFVEIHSYGIGLDGKATNPGLSPGESPDTSVLLRSAHGGSAWSQINLPRSAWLSSPVSCSTALDCAVGASIGGRAAELHWGTGRAVLLVTTNGGSTWTQRPLPPGVGPVTGLSCPSSSHCVALAVTGTTINGREPYDGAERFYPTTVLVTTNGGRTWTKANYPAEPADASYQITAVDCPSVTRCYFAATRSQIVDDMDGSYTQSHDAALVLASRDGGRSLTIATSPGAGAVSSLSCINPSDCLAVVSGSEVSSVWSTHDGGASWARFMLQGAASQIRTVKCVTDKSCIGLGPSRAFSSDDSGAHWTAMRGIGALNDVACNQDISVVSLF